MSSCIRAWMARSRRSSTLAVLVLLVAALVPQFTWWRGSSLVWGDDGTLPLRLSEIGHFFSISPATSSAPDVRKLPFLYPWGLILEAWDKCGLPWDASVGQHVEEFLLLFASGLGALVWSRRLLPRLSTGTVTIAALFYMFNPFALTTVWSSQSNLMIHYSLLPFLALAVVRLGERPSLRAACVVAVLWSILLTPAYITTPLVITDVLLVSLLLTRAVFLARDRRARRKTFVSAAVLFSTFLLLNAFWIWPLVSYYQTEVARGTALIGNQSDQAFALNSTPLSEAVRLNGYWGLKSGIQGYPYFPWAAYYYQSWASLLAYLPMLLTAIGLVFYPLSGRLRGMTRAERASLLLTGLSVAALVVAVTGSRPPFGPLNTRVLTNLHLLDVFRSVYARFTEYLPLAMAPLIAAGLQVLWHAISSSERATGRVRGVRVGAAAASVSVLGALVAIVVPWPMWSGALFDQSGPVPAARFDLPRSAGLVGQLIDAQDGDFAVAALPMGTSSMTYLRWPAGGFTGIQPYSLLTGKSVILGDVGSPAATRLSEVFRVTPAAACVTLKSLNVRDLVLDVSPNLAITSWNSALGADVAATRRALSNLPCLRLAHRFADVELYVNDQWTPHRFFATSRAQGVESEEALPYREVFPGVYRVRAPSSAESNDIVVNTPSDFSWRIQNGTRLREGDLTTFRLSGRARSTSVLLWNQTQVVSEALLALALMLTFTVALGRPAKRFCRFSYQRIRGDRVLKEAQDEHALAREAAAADTPAPGTASDDTEREAGTPDPTAQTTATAQTQAAPVTNMHGPATDAEAAALAAVAAAHAAARTPGAASAWRAAVAAVEAVATGQAASTAERPHT